MTEEISEHCRNDLHYHCIDPICYCLCHDGLYTRERRIIYEQEQDRINRLNRQEVAAQSKTTITQFP